MHNINEFHWMSTKAYLWAHMEQWNIFANNIFFCVNFQAYIASEGKSNLSYSFNLLIFCIENKLEWYKFMFSFAAISKENNLGHFQDNKIRSPDKSCFVVVFFFHGTIESFTVGNTFECTHCF